MPGVQLFLLYSWTFLPWVAFPSQRINLRKWISTHHRAYFKLTGREFDAKCFDDTNRSDRRRAGVCKLISRQLQKLELFLGVIVLVPAQLALVLGELLPPHLLHLPSPLPPLVQPLSPPPVNVSSLFLLSLKALHWWCLNLMRLHRIKILMKLFTFRDL